MPTSTSPFLLQALKLTLKKITNPDGSAATGTATEYRCQLNAASLVPAAGGAGGGTTNYITFCQEFETETTPAGGGSWNLNLAGFQAYADVQDLSMILFTDEGAIYQYLLTPVGGTISATNPGFQGYVKMTPTTIGGTAQTYASFTVDLPCVTLPSDATSTIKPKVVTTPPVALEAESELVDA